LKQILNREVPPIGLIVRTDLDVKNHVLDREGDYGDLKSKKRLNEVPLALTLVYEKDLPLETLPASPFNITISNCPFSLFIILKKLKLPDFPDFPANRYKSFHPFL